MLKENYKKGNYTKTVISQKPTFYSGDLKKKIFWDWGFSFFKHNIFSVWVFKVTPGSPAFITVIPLKSGWSSCCSHHCPQTWLPRGFASHLQQIRKKKQQRQMRSNSLKRKEKKKSISSFLFAYAAVQLGLYQYVNVNLHKKKRFWLCAD